MKWPATPRPLFTIQNFAQHVEGMLRSARAMQHVEGMLRSARAIMPIVLSTLSRALCY
jgi:hypothetical protein